MQGRINGNQLRDATIRSGVGTRQMGPPQTNQQTVVLPKIDTGFTNPDGTLAIPWYQTFLNMIQSLASKVGEAPQDGQFYVRRNGQWVVMP